MRREAPGSGTSSPPRAAAELRPLAGRAPGTRPPGAAVGEPRRGRGAEEQGSDPAW